MAKPKVLVLGGCGFIGRNLVSFLVKNNLVSALRVVDKVPPQIAWLNQNLQVIFNSEVVEFKSANLINPESCKAAFATEESWDFVINCAGETKSSLTDPVYKEGILNLSLNCAKQAALHKVGRYVELSSGCMYSSEKIPHKEDGPVEPWSFVAKWKRMVEKQLDEIPDLKYTVLRLAMVYGKGDKTGIMPRLLGASIYRQLNQTMKLLWDPDLRINTVHVEDVSRAIWFVCNRDDTLNNTYNVVDEADSTQGSVFSMISDMFNIKVDFVGTIISSAVDLEGIADHANDKHMAPWAEACRKDGIQNTPLSPHMDSEALLHKHLRLDGSKLRALGFSLEVPKPTIEKFEEILDDYIEMKIFPKSLK